MGSVLSSKYQDNFKKRELYNEIFDVKSRRKFCSTDKKLLETENEYKNIYEENEANPMSAFFYARAIFKSLF